MDHPLSSIILLAALEHQRKVGKETLSKILKGSTSTDLLKRRLHNSPFYARLQNYNINNIEYFIEQLMQKALLKQIRVTGYYYSYPVLEVTPLGLKAIKEKANIPLKIKPFNPKEDINFNKHLRATLEVFKITRSIPKTAERRRLAISTIENHLYSLFLLDKISLDELVKKSKQKKILNTIKKLGTDSRLTEIKDFLGDKFSYFEIRCVQYAKRKQEPPKI